MIVRGSRGRGALRHDAGRDEHAETLHGLARLCRLTDLAVAGGMESDEFLRRKAEIETARNCLSPEAETAVTASWREHIDFVLGKADALGDILNDDYPNDLRRARLREVRKLPRYGQNHSACTGISVHAARICQLDCELRYRRGREPASSPRYCASCTHKRALANVRFVLGGPKPFDSEPQKQ